MFHKSYVVDGKNSGGYAEHETQAELRVSVITGLVCSGTYQRMSLYFLLHLL